MLKLYSDVARHYACSSNILSMETWKDVHYKLTFSLGPVCADEQPMGSLGLLRRKGPVLTAWKDSVVLIDRALAHLITRGDRLLEVSRSLGHGYNIAGSYGLPIFVLENLASPLPNL